MEVATIIEVVTKGNELAASNRPELLCGFCYDTYRDPRILPCGHTFCLQCLNKNMKTNGNNQRQTCGLCRQHWSVPEEGLSGLPKNFALREACPEPDSPPVRRCAMEGEGSKVRCLSVVSCVHVLSMFFCSNNAFICYFFIRGSWGCEVFLR